MGIWIEAVEARARLIHQEIAGAQVLARSRGLDPQLFTGGLYDELARLYRDNYAYAQLADHADLIARYRGPGVLNREPPISLVTGLFGKLKEEIRAIARAIAGMEATSKVRWPAELDPRLASPTAAWWWGCGCPGRETLAPMARLSYPGSAMSCTAPFAQRCRACPPSRS